MNNIHLLKQVYLAPFNTTTKFMNMCSHFVKSSLNEVNWDRIHKYNQALNSFPGAQWNDWGAIVLWV